MNCLAWAGRLLCPLLGRTLVRDKVRLAVSEAVTNCVVHAYPEQAPGDVTVKAWVGDDGQLVLVVAGDSPSPDGHDRGVVMARAKEEGSR